MRYAVGMTTGRASGAAAILLLVTAFAVACTSSTTPATDAGTPAIDAGTPAIDAAISPDGSSPEAAVPDAGCVGPCATLSLDATYGAKTARFERAQFGWDKQAGKVSGITTEAHAGGRPECPTQASPTPDRTVVISGVPIGSAGKTLTQADGVAVTLFDFKSVLTDKPLDKATAVKLTVVSIEGDAPERVAFDLEATFVEGKIVGHVFAEHCKTMDE
jgi:hypothetical protein